MAAVLPSLPPGSSSKIDFRSRLLNETTDDEKRLFGTCLKTVCLLP